MASIAPDSAPAQQLQRPPAVPPRRRSFAPYLMVTPLILVLGLVLMVPLIRLIIVSLQDLRARPDPRRRPTEWVGLANVHRSPVSEQFWESLWITVNSSWWRSTITLVLGLLLAHLLPKVSPGCGSPCCWR